MSITRDELVSLHQRITDQARDLMVKKNADYAGGGEDVLANFRHYGMVGLNPAQGIATRMIDKLSRASGLVSGHIAQVDDESVEDTATDLINYAVLLVAASKEEPR